jgi:DNA-nicking Smr family endonuclease
MKKLSDEDRMIWHHIAQAIQPMRGKTKPPAPVPSRAHEASQHSFVPESKSKPEQPAPFDPAMRKALTRKKRGIDARLDLHGLSQGAAHSMVMNFIDTAGQRGCQIVLIITGKGKGEEGGILRRYLPIWLEHPAMAEKIVSFEPAPPKYGGTGAWVIHLRKLRKSV